MKILVHRSKLSWDVTKMAPLDKSEEAMGGAEERPAASAHDSGGRQRHRRLALRHLPRRDQPAGTIG